MRFWFGISNFLLFQSASSPSWVKEKCEASARKVTEMAQAYNDIAGKYNKLQTTFELMKSENAHLTKKLKESKATISVQEVELG